LVAEPTRLHDSGAQLQIALHAADIVGIWDGDLVARRVYGDANFARIYGVDPAEAGSGVPLGAYLERIHPDDVATVRGAMERLYAGAPDYANEHRILRPDGSVIWVLTRGRLVHDAAGTAVRFAGVSVDITQRKAAEVRQAFLLALADALRSPSDTRAIVGAAVTLLGRFLVVNRVGFGQVQSDDATILLETSYADGIAPLAGSFPMHTFGLRNIARHRAGETIVLDDLETYRRDEPDAFRGSEIRAVVSVPLLRDGRLRATLFVSSRQPRHWKADEVEIIESVAARIWDAIERVRAEDALRALNATLEAEVERRTRERERNWRLAPVLMVTGKSGGVLQRVNPAWTRILGWSTEDTVGRELSEFIARDEPEAAASAMRQLQSGEPMRDFLLDFRTRSGERRRIAWTTVDEDGHFYGYGRDVTEQLIAEDRLRQSQKMEAVGQLTGGLAHDFNNLLTGIGGSLELLNSRLSEGRLEDAARLIVAARDATARAAAVTHRLLAFSRRQTLDPRATNLNNLVAGMLDLIRSTAGPSHRIDTELEAALWTTLVDPPQLENALLNLSINARDAMPAGGRIEITTANCEIHAGDARELDIPAGDYVCLRVRDTGVGMTPETLSRAFDPFFTTKPVGSGTGLGLSMIYGFARQSGGHVGIRSTVGQGTTVALYLPRHAGPAEIPEEARAVPAGKGSVGQGRMALVIDDEPTVRMLAREVLGDYGFTTLEGETAAEGIATLEANLEIDLLITDVGLPGGQSGRQLAAAARRLRPDLRVLFITGYTSDSRFTENLGARMQLLTKPFTLDALSLQIAALMEDAEPAGPHAA
jgi:PAS domain S-box-containing protein